MLVKIKEDTYLNPQYVIELYIRSSGEIYLITIKYGAIKNSSTETISLKYDNREDVDKLIESLNVV